MGMCSESESGLLELCASVLLLVDQLARQYPSGHPTDEHLLHTCLRVHPPGQSEPCCLCSPFESRHPERIMTQLYSTLLDWC